MDNTIKIGFCVAYDWYLLAHSIPPIYELADTIILSIDKERISWAGKKYSWNQEKFEKLISRLDYQNKITVYEDNFHLSNLKPMENEVRQRHLLAQQLGEGGWHIQLDTDEVLASAKELKSILQRVPKHKHVNVCCPWINLYKQDNDGFFFVKPESFKKIEFIQIATHYPKYDYGRRNGYFNILTNIPLVHITWARSESEIKEKISNWGHSQDFDQAEYFAKWKNLNASNFHLYKNFHHLGGEVWNKIEFVPARDFKALVASENLREILPIKNYNLMFSNSIFYSRLKKLFKYFST